MRLCLAAAPMLARALTPAAFFAAAFVLAAPPALSLESFVLENVTSRTPDGEGEVLIRRVEVEGANFGRAELQMLLSDLPAGERAAAASRFEARRIAAPEVLVIRSGKNKGRFVLRGYEVLQLKGGRFERAGFQGFDGAFNTEDGEGRIESGPITLDGGDFSSLIEAARKGEIADGVAKMRRFSWSGLRITVPDGDVPATAVGGNLYTISIKSMEGSTDYSGDVPVRMLGNMQGLVFAAPKASEAGQMLASIGYDRLELGLTMDASYDPATRALSLTEYKLEGASSGALSVSATLGNVDPGAFTGDQLARVAAMMNANVSGLDVRWTEGGLFDKALAWYATSQRKSVAAARKEWLMATMMLPVLAGGDPAAMRLTEAMGAFIRKPGTFSLSLRSRGTPLGLADFMRLSDPSFLLSRVEVMAVANR